MRHEDALRRLLALREPALAIDLAYVDALLDDGGRARLREGDAALPGLNLLAGRHCLTSFDRDLLLLGASPNLDRKYVRRFERTDGEAMPSVGLVLELLGEAAGLSRELVMTRLGRGAPLRTNGLLSVVGDRPFAGRRLHVPDIVWQRMLGIEEHDERLAPMPDADLVARDAMRERIAEAAAHLDRRTGVVIVSGPPDSGRTAIARAVATHAGRDLVRVSRTAGVSDIVREARWYDAIPLISHAAVPIDELLLDCPSAIFELAPAEVSPPLAARAFQIHAERFDGATRIELWRRRLGDAAAEVDLPFIAGAFAFGPGMIEAAAELATTSARVRDAPLTEADVTAACQAVTPAFALRAARPLSSELTLLDLVLPSATRSELELAIAWSQHRMAIRDSRHGPHLRMSSGLTCLFSGPSGTGKTTAAGAVARELGLPIHAVDLSQVVDKYIGETEKHLGRLFDEAETANVILFFDEADALFARRTEVRDAHDRFANVETGYLLQRLEQHPGIVILATNMRGNFDEAFARRIQVIVEFPVPGLAEREELWRRMVPPSHDHLDIALLAARFPFSGGTIRNAVVAALVLASADGTELAMRHLIVATWREMQRSGRLGSGSEFAGWEQELAPWLPGNGSGRGRG